MATKNKRNNGIHGTARKRNTDRIEINHKERKEHKEAETLTWMDRMNRMRGGGSAAEESLRLAVILGHSSMERRRAKERSVAEDAEVRREGKRISPGQAEHLRYVWREIL